MPKKINVPALVRRAHQKKKKLSAFLKSLHKRKLPTLLTTVKNIDKEVWAEIDCLQCANCCKTMTPTFKKSEVTKIATHLNMSYKEYFDKYLMIDEDNGDIVNQNTPCQHLNLKTNMCSIYEIRPHDCSGFPHFVRKDFLDQTKVYAENLHRCPATLAMVEKLEKQILHAK
jgi:Fe-S-cluster containining protein